MKHKIPFNLLSRYIDGRCSEADRKKVETHLPECDVCRKNILLLKNSASAMRHLDAEKLSGDFDYRFKEGLKERIKSREEKEFRFIMKDIFEKTRVILVPPRGVLVKAVIFLVVAIFSYGILTYTFVESPSISAVSGDVSIYSKREKRWIPFSEGLELARGDIINVKEDSFLDIEQSDKYTVRIKENSQITVVKALPKYIPGTLIYRIGKGKAFIAINKTFKGSKFIVKTPEAVATALGTEFFVDVSALPERLTRFGVLEGKVKVRSLFSPEEYKELREVIVAGGEATEVYRGKIPTQPRGLLEKEWEEMVEFYQIGKKPQVALLISNGKYRTRELLRPCPIYISEIKPKRLEKYLEETIYILDEGIRTDNREKQLEGIGRLEKVLANYSSASYEPQLRLFIGSYYNYLMRYDDALQAFRMIAEKYPKSTFASMALYATGIVYDEGLNNKPKAREYYDIVVREYPESPEAEMIRELRIK